MGFTLLQCVSLIAHANEKMVQKKASKAKSKASKRGVTRRAFQTRSHLVKAINHSGVFKGR